jgi:LysR family hydrogen peroxide-inducible transcriptional activator
MNLRDLSYLVALEDHEHFGKAADHCFVSQPTLSMQIKKLEETLGVQLIERKNRSFILTEVGKKIADKAREVLYHVDVMKDFAKQSKDPYQGELLIGLIPTLAPYLLPFIVSGLSNFFPNLKIYWVEKQTSLLLQDLAQGKLDAAILALPIPEERFINQLLFEEEFLLAVPVSHDLGKRKMVKIEELNQEELLLLGEGHCFREQALSFCQQAHLPVKKTFEATSLETLRHMVASKLGITLIPRLASKLEDGLNYLRFSESCPSRTIGLVWRESGAKQVLLQDFASKIRDLLSAQSAKTGVRVLDRTY